MHCPTCRHDNPNTTRFCNACGAVMVEDAPGGGRRRVLRPWGLRRSAPLTESPAMPELAAMSKHPPRFDPSVRLDLVLAGVVVVGIIAGTALFPRSMASDAPPVLRATGAGHGPEVVTTVIAPALKATSVTAPALVEPDVAPRPVAPAPRPARNSDAARTPPPAAAPVAPPVTTPEREPEPPAPAPVPASPPPAPRDRWDPLRDALSACKAQKGILDRAMCEQAARISHCTEHWDLVDLCPTGRPSVTQ